MTHTEYRVWELDGCICYECNRKPEPRKFSWMKKVRRSELKAVYTTEQLTPVVGGLSQMGMEFIEDQPADYDTGDRYVVLEVCTDLEWAVIDSVSNSTVKRISLDFDDAKRYCDDINRSEKETWR